MSNVSFITMLIFLYVYFSEYYLWIVLFGIDIYPAIDYFM